MNNSKFTNNIIIEKNDDDFNYIEFLELNELGIQNLYTLKDLDFGKYETNKDKEKNYLKLAKMFNIPLDKIIYLDQTHSANILTIQKDLDLKKSRSNFDGIVTDRSDIAIMTFNADCILFVLYDKKKKVLANIHSGWEGTTRRIMEVIIDIFITDFNSNVEDIVVCISPSIRACHFEVKEDVKEIFVQKFKEISPHLFINEEEITQKDELNKNKSKSYYIDIIYLNKYMMLKKGILEKNIYDSNICSICHKDKIHSYRASSEEDKFKRAIFIAKLSDE